MEMIIGGALPGERAGKKRLCKGKTPGNLLEKWRQVRGIPAYEGRGGSGFPGIYP